MHSTPNQNLDLDFPAAVLQLEYLKFAEKLIHVLEL
jgi:hypothetical protein